ncbi:Ras association domain-containing protein 7 [Oryzias melastigma]|uniref:Ras association domain family member 7b n=1 Tax=Oryzias melastigma TaxID=30732 RepID=A0A3B3C6K4_ORYME|nr:ras association domain-containing protein 8 [Oryzias melastigma]XP_036067714.1 ras association domain-containing protein 8 [Oryzias melastigma]XP_036067715.1 ras association domain-containing protein 8 [Oryzias melastigma]KAF6721049.1 Ras association domain-containing protein 7 [Oryzias melastigma]
MELKVWVEGVLRVVCGLSLSTSCQDVVIALAQAIGQTGRYTLTMKYRGNERTLVADDCPLQQLAQLGPLAAEVQFVLQRTGPTLSEDSHNSAIGRGLLPSRPSEPIKHKGPQKALTFNLGPSSLPRRSKQHKAVSSSPRSSPDPSSHSSDSEITSKEEVFWQILQHQSQLQDLELQIEALEKETVFLEQESSPADVFSLSPAFTEELADLEQQFRQNEVEMMYGDTWEEELQVETDLELARSKRLEEIYASIDEQNEDMKELRTQCTKLEQEVDLRIQRESSQMKDKQKNEALMSLTQKLQNRLQLGEELERMLSETQRELQTAEERGKEKQEIIKELNKELRQSNLQHFIHQAGGTPLSEQKNPLHLKDVYLKSSSMMEEKL